MKTTLLTLLPLLSLALAETRTPFLHTTSTTPTSLLTRRQLSACPLGQSVCDEQWCGEVCCNLGNGNSCPTGSYCDGSGCCKNGKTCSGTPTCTSRSVPGCTLKKDCCPEDTPYCILDEFGSNICSVRASLDGDSDGGIIPDLDDLFGGDDDAATTTSTSVSTGTATRSVVEDEPTTTSTRVTTPTTTDDGSGLSEDLDDVFDRITSKAGDVIDAVATGGGSSADDLKDKIKDALGEEKDSAGMRQMVGMGVAVGLGAVLGAMVVM